MSPTVLLTAIICALVVVSTANVGQMFIGGAVSDEYPGQCYYKDEKVPIKIGDTYKAKEKCAELICRDDFVLRFNLCPAYGNVRPECERIQDKEAPYPKCCLTFKCPQ